MHFFPFPGFFFKQLLRVYLNVTCRSINKSYPEPSTVFMET